MRVEREGVTFEVTYDEFWERATWEGYTYRWLKALLDRDTDFIDVGAWIGPFTLFASRLSGRVLAIEPDPFAYGWLLQNLALNDPRNVYPHYGGVWDEAGTHRLYKIDEGWSSSKSTMLAAATLAEHVVVPVTPLVPLVNQFTGQDTSRRTVIKIDTEGAEGPILSAAMDWIEATKPSLIIAPHERLYPDPLMLKAVRSLKAIYPTAINQNGVGLVWPDGSAPEPSMMLFTTEDIEA